MNLINIIVHHIDKKRGEDAQLHLRDSVLPINPTLVEFSKSVQEAYYKKSNPIWGVFDENTINYPLPLFDLGCSKTKRADTFGGWLCLRRSIK